MRCPDEQRANARTQFGAAFVYAVFDEGSSVEDWQYLGVGRRGNVSEYGG